MARRNTSPGYQSYYGRRSSRSGTLLKWIIVFLLAVLVVSVAAYLWLQNNLVYDDNGVYLPMPWKQRESEQQPASTSVSPSPTGSIAPPSPSEADPTDSVLVIESPEPTLAPRDLARETLHAVEVTPQALLDGTAAQQVADAGGNALLVTMKNDGGTLNYVSKVDLAVSLNASGSDSGVNRAIQDLAQGDCYTIARVSCFRDEVMGGISEYALLSNSGYRWRDFNGIRWSCVGKAATRDYIAAICAELAELGFDEILLTNCGYPPNGTGQMGWLRRDDTYPWGSLDTVVGPFLDQVKQAIEPYGAVLSVEALGRELAGEEQATGLTVGNVSASCAHLWMDASDVLAYQAAIDGNEALKKLVVPMSAQSGETDSPWAVVAEE